MRFWKKPSPSQAISKPVEEQLSAEVLSHLHWVVDRIEDDFQHLMNRASTLLGFSAVEIGFLVQGYKSFDRQFLEYSCLALFIAIAFFFAVLWTRKAPVTMGNSYRTLVMQSNSQQTFTIAQQILKYDKNEASLIDNGLKYLKMRGYLLRLGLIVLVSAQLFVIFTIHKGV